MYLNLIYISLPFNQFFFFFYIIFFLFSYFSFRFFFISIPSVLLCSSNNDESTFLFMFFLWSCRSTRITRVIQLMRFLVVYSRAFHHRNHNLYDVKKILFIGMQCLYAQIMLWLKLIKMRSFHEIMDAVLLFNDNIKVYQPIMFRVSVFNIYWVLLKTFYLLLSRVLNENII